jgi:hypothetical protein
MSQREKSYEKIRSVFEHFISKFKSVYTPNKCIAIDESLMLWKGRLGMKQYIPLKRARFGLKTYELCEAGTGYTWNSIIHTGPHMILSDANDNLVSSRIVMTLMQTLLGKGYTLFVDNWYSSPALFEELVSNKTNAVGTVRINRKNMPKELKSKIKKGETVCYFTNHLMALKWHDKRQVAMLSNYHTSAMATITNYSGEKQKPEVIIDYNANMGAVDVADQMLSAYPVERKRHKIWYKKQFKHLRNQAVLNSYILFKKCNPEKNISHLEFPKSLVQTIFEKFPKGIQQSRSQL